MRLPKNFFYSIALLIIFSPVIIIFSRMNKGKGQNNLLHAEGFSIFLVFLVIAIILVIYSKYEYNKSLKKWKSGVFNHKTKFSQDSLLEAYIRLGGLMLRKDRDDLKGKMAYLYRYVDQHFADSEVDMAFALKSSYQHPVDLKAIGAWLKTNLRSTSQRSQLIYFLAGLSAVDGSINPKEKQYLVQLSDLLGLSKKDFDSIMAMYSKFEDSYRNQSNQHRAPSKSRQQYEREKAAEILGVSLQASVDEIKKAYRSLAKVHHPDRFATQSEYQQKIAKERFIKIQLAYELILEFKN